MDKRHYKILETAASIGPRDLPVDFTGEDYPAALYLYGKGLVRGGPVELNGGVCAVRVGSITPSGLDALDERRGRVGRLIVDNLVTIIASVATSLVTMLVVELVKAALKK